MKEDVQQILTDLYAIRAGMSVISEKKDEIDQKFKSAKEKLLPLAKKTNNDIETTTIRYGIYTNSLGYIESDKDSPVKDHYEPEDFRCSVCGAIPEKGGNYNYECPVCGSVVVRHARQADRQAPTRDLNVTESESFVRNTRYSEKTVNYIKEQVPRLQREAAFNKKKLSTYIAFLIIGILVAFAGVICVISGSGVSDRHGLILGGIAIGIVGVILIIVFGGLIYSNNEDGTVGRSKHKYEASLAATAEVAEFNKTAEKTLKEIEQTSAPLYESCNALSDELAEKYTSISRRDWKYTDTLIYYFETGRADSVKEALQHLDREIQTNEIISTIERSTNYICNTIRACTREITARLDRISEQLSEISFKQNIIIGQQALQTALMAKMASSSESLAADVNYMAERARYHSH